MVSIDFTLFTMPMNLDTYFAVEEDKRVIQSTFDFESINDMLPSAALFGEDELARLNASQDECWFFMNRIICTLSDRPSCNSLNLQYRSIFS